MNQDYSTWITRYRSAMTDLLTALDELSALDKQNVAQGMSGKMANGTRVSTDEADTQFGDFAGTNSAITITDINSASSSHAALNTFLTAGYHWTNFYPLKK